jgi:voltage-gated potassium channel
LSIRLSAKEKSKLMKDTAKKIHLNSERLKLLRNINDLTDRPLTYLSFIWFGIIIFELTVGVNEMLEYTSLVIWMIFIADFLLELTIAPSIKKYLQSNWLSALTLLLPALRIFRIFNSLRALRAVRSLRSLNLLKMVSSLNHSMTALRKFATNYGLRYIFVFTALILVAGAAGILFFENTQALTDRGIRGEGINSYVDALWWSAMLMTTIGSEYWPQTIEGRILTVVLSLYAIAIFGYITATLASLLIEKNKKV